MAGEEEVVTRGALFRWCFLVAGGKLWPLWGRDGGGGGTGKVREEEDDAQ